ncbi:uncharacterized protein LOC116180523 [Photinus pyralis]|uniref:uncharacterized protein LOC116179766 n=1 Tax=Photinus pyralis TaxID=7054 RepID=UPI00126718D8|nr:uncharacterized protein LOC116158575 isoform X1 [Photinus pyralis]XP_031327232.1 uncharacterized protein LOC116158575 isoform X2 [Photinus pyralis]XP_031355455.1 uncharacterized protein LOC116179766 [Photinus pyralis]XP_031356419.1 uncharacterized protein LOC116180523 [Photinus pyralis]
MDQPSISLLPEDVPGAVLRHGVNIEDHSNLELQRWLECRALKKTGNKTDLVQRVVNCIEAGRSNSISLAIDGGKWYDMKRNVVVTASTSTAASGPASDETLLWARFPSREIPQYFNKGHIYTYLVGCFFENEDYVSNNTGVTEKPFRRGSQFVSSDHLHEVFDSSDNRFYLLKAKCFASFNKNKLYSVVITLNKASGAVVNGRCECKQSALGKCSHVSALLLFLEKFCGENGHDNTACTSKLRQWGLGAKLKKPGPISQKKYGNVRFEPIRRATFDPRPDNYERTVNINNFICDLQKERLPTMFETLFQLRYDDFKLDQSSVDIVIQQVLIFKKNMDQELIKQKNIFSVEGAEIQHSLGWFRWRSYFITASNAKTASSLVSLSAKNNYLKRNLWQLTPNLLTAAMRYGQVNEAKARDKYVADHIQPNEQFVQVGLYMNKKYPHLACSADGVVTTNGVITRVIEIKCPKVLEDKDPCQWNSVLTGQQQSNFFAYEENNKVFLKANHPYNYQVATTMLIFEVPECDFVVWSSVGLLVFKVQLSDISRHVIDDITKKLKKMYYNMYIPELFLMRIPRNLPLFELDYFQE